MISRSIKTNSHLPSQFILSMLIPFCLCLMQGCILKDEPTGELPSEPIVSAQTNSSVPSTPNIPSDEISGAPFASALTNNNISIRTNTLYILTIDEDSILSTYGLLEETFKYEDFSIDTDWLLAIEKEFRDYYVEELPYLSWIGMKLQKAPPMDTKEEVLVAFLDYLEEEMGNSLCPRPYLEVAFRSIYPPEIRWIRPRFCEEKVLDMLVRYADVSKVVAGCRPPEINIMDISTYNLDARKALINITEKRSGQVEAQFMEERLASASFNLPGSTVSEEDYHEFSKKTIQQLFNLCSINERGLTQSIFYFLERLHGSPQRVRELIDSIKGGPSPVLLSSLDYVSASKQQLMLLKKFSNPVPVGSMDSRRVEFDLLIDFFKTKTINTKQNIQPQLWAYDGLAMLLYGQAKTPEEVRGLAGSYSSYGREEVLEVLFECVVTKDKSDKIGCSNIISKAVWLDKATAFFIEEKAIVLSESIANTDIDDNTLELLSEIAEVAHKALQEQSN